MTGSPVADTIMLTTYHTEGTGSSSRRSPLGIGAA